MSTKRDRESLRLALEDTRRKIGALEKLEKAEKAESPDTTEPIAVIGIGCRLPGGVEGADEFWQFLLDGRDAVTETPKSRWDLDEFYDPDPHAPGRMYARHGAYLDEVEGFDAEFFGIGRREAECMDPQHRLLLETTWHALENAGRVSSALRGSDTGVFVGLCFDDYARYSLHSGDPARIDALSSLGASRSVGVGRLCHQFDFRGPAMTLDTTCSSSLLAVHLAAQSLRSGDCGLAIAGGANVMISPEMSIAFSRLGALSAHGRCQTFDASADGYVRGEGCGILVLARLSDAVERGDPIWGVIRGSAVNHDGRSNGLSAPNGRAQTEVIEAALRQAGVSPGDVQYLEAHGTGTPLGDPIEMNAAARAYEAINSRTSRLRVGSVKTNLGHLEAAAGVAGMIKALLAVHHGVIPAHLHFENPNPHIRWDDLAIDVPTDAQPWPATESPRRAGVSAFGMSGTNVHVVIEEAPKPRDESPPSYAFSRQNYWLAKDRGAPPAILRTEAPASSTVSKPELQEYLFAQLAALTSHPAEAIELDTPLSDVGMDSLAAVDLCLAVKEDLGRALSEELLLEDGTTVADLIEHLFDDSAPRPAADLDLNPETVLSEDIRPEWHGSPSSTPRIILLTGATGFFGRYLLRELLRETDATVVCLVRAADVAAAQKRIERALEPAVLSVTEWSRVRCVIGDVAQPLLGLSEGPYRELSASVDHIYHSAAALNYVSPYSQLKSVNVGGTIELLRFACRGQAKQFHLMSSVAVLEAEAYRGAEVDEHRDVDRFKGMSIGYSQTKWVAERLVLAASHRGLPTTVHRLPLVSGDSETGVWLEENVFCMLLKACVQAGAVPFDLDILLDFVPVNSLARAVARLTLESSSLRVFHLNNSRRMHWTDFVQVLRSWGYPMEPVPYARWRELVEAQDENILRPMLPFFRKEVPGAGGLTYLELQQRGHCADIRGEETREILAKREVVLPGVTLQLWELYRRWLEKNGLLGT